MRLLSAFFALFCLFAHAGAEETAPAPASAAPPQWYLDDVEFLTRDGGRWIASNEQYQSDDEPIEAYGIEWKKGYANSMTGRLFGIMNGEETGDYWRFRQYWHPGEQKAVVEQFGFGGVIGVGHLWNEGEKNKTEQSFYALDGSVNEQGHIAQNPDNDTHVTESFDIVDGEWKPRRIYTWKRDAAGDNAGGEE